MNGTSLVNGNGHLKYSANLVDNDTNLNGTNTFGNKNSIKMATNGHIKMQIVFVELEQTNSQKCIE